MRPPSSFPWKECCMFLCFGHIKIFLSNARTALCSDAFRSHRYCWHSTFLPETLHPSTGSIAVKCIFPTMNSAPTQLTGLPAKQDLSAVLRL